jgi:hypothetical protein
MSEVGVITEQGDLGLGYNPITESEKKILEEKGKETDEDRK